MSLTIDLSIDIATDRETQILNDLTVYGSPARNTCRVFASAYKMDYSNVATTLTCTGNTANPATDSTWTTDFTIDGWYKYYFVIVTAAYSAGTTYNIYDAVYSGSSVYRSKTNSNLGNPLNDTGHWEVVADPSLLANNKGTASESLNITSIVYLRVLSANSQYTFATLLADQCLCSDCDESESLQAYNIFAMWLDGMAIADNRSEVLDGELIARKVQARFIDC